MNVEIGVAEAKAILEALERKASEPTSVFQAAVRAKVRRKMRVIVAGPSPELTKALGTILKDVGDERIDNGQAVIDALNALARLTEAQKNGWTDAGLRAEVDLRSALGLILKNGGDS